MKCAIYTRKSTDKGLEQDFNSLDAQREACLAYIASQKHEGWSPVKKIYDDGGYSGGNIDRPALQELIEDIKSGNINIVVVYKIDRLTRSLADFAKLVEVFDQHNVSFVSVTQSFNTTTSMGRLTLNVLLSFAQFARAVIGERIRDKIAASKKKGMWMGGCPPLGYDVKDRQLIINDAEAKKVELIFDSYLRLQTIPKLKEYLDAEGIKSKAWISRNGREYKGQSHGIGALHHLLSNPVYAGYTRHRKELNEGMHNAIIPREKWLQVQECLKNRSATERGKRKQSLQYAFKGKIFDVDGVIYTPMRSNKGNKRYYYYVSQNYVQNRKSVKDAISRLPAHEIEELIENAILKEISSVDRLQSILGCEVDYKSLSYISENIKGNGINCCVIKVIIDVGNIKVEASVSKLVELINKSVNTNVSCINTPMVHRVDIPYHTKRAQRGAVVLRLGDGKDPLDLPNNKLEALVKGVIWREEHFKGKSFRQIAKADNVNESYVRQLINRSFI